MKNFGAFLIGLGIGLFVKMFFSFGHVQKTGPYDEYYKGREVTISTWELNIKHLWCLLPLTIAIIGIVIMVKG